METENLGGGSAGEGARRAEFRNGESLWRVVWTAPLTSLRTALRRRGVGVGLLLLWTGILGAWAEPVAGGFERGLGVRCWVEDGGGAAAGVGVWTSASEKARAGALHSRDAGVVDAGAAISERGENASRARRGPRGRLGFGTFEAWCYSHPLGAVEGGVTGRCTPSVAGLQIPAVAGVRVPAVAGVRVPGNFTGERATITPRYLGGVTSVAFQDEVCFPGQGALQKDAPLEVEASRSRVPPSLKAVVRYFEEALGEDPVYEEGDKFRFERWEGFAWGASWRRCLVSGGGGAVCLEWWANDDFGVSELREFFEAPFFELSESLVLHQWMSEGGWHSGVLRGARLAMGVLARGDYVYVRIRWWQPPV